MSFPSRDDVAGGHDHCDALTQRRVKAISRIGRGDSIVRDGVRVPIEALIGNASETHQNGEARLAELARHLADAKPTCRIQSLRAIARIAPIGHPVATAKAVMHLQDNDHAVRCEAIETLSRVAARGDRLVVGTLIDALVGESTIFRNPVQPGDYRDFTRPNGSLLRAPRRPAAHVGFTTANLRIAALRALGTIAGEGDVRAVACLVRLAEDWDEQVRDAAATILVAMGKSGLAGATTAALPAHDPC
jgi:HEAT repeat protein